MNEIIECVCHRIFVNNPDKHKYRQKLCPRCRRPYTHEGLWIPNLDFLNLKKWLQNLKEKHRESNYRGKALHSLRLELAREPTDSELDRRVDKLKRDDEMMKEERKREKLYR